MSIPCIGAADQFTASQFCQATVDRLAAEFCDRCPERAACYRSALRDERAWGVYGGVLFANGEPVPSALADQVRPRTAAVA